MQKLFQDELTELFNEEEDEEDDKDEEVERDIGAPITELPSWGVPEKGDQLSILLVQKTEEHGSAPSVRLSYI